MNNFETFLNKCRDGNFFAVETILPEGISPDRQNAEGETGLQISAANGYLDIVKLLLKNGASVDLANNYGWTPLMHAARHGHHEVVSFLIQIKAKINISNRLGVRPIDVAAWHGNLSCLKLLIEAGAIIDSLSVISSQNDICDISPLMVASLRGHNSALKTLLEKGSAVNQASPITGLTPLMLAACNGFKNIIEILIGFDCDANITDICDRTALDLAIVCCRDDVTTFLANMTQPTLKKYSGNVLHDINIFQVVRTGDVAQMKSLLQHNQNFSNYRDPNDGVTPLMIACMLGFTNIVDLLISNGADLNAQDKTNGWTPLMYAVFHRQAETVHLLLDKGADIDIYTSNGYTALDLAIHADSSETDILATLLAHSASEELLDPGDYLRGLSSSSSTIKQSHLACQKAPSRSDSQARLKDIFGGFSSHLRQFSRSSAQSTNIDPEILDETLYDVFPDEDVKEASTEGKFLCLSKFYAPNERFAHLVKEQEVEAINLPPLPSHVSSVDLVKTICPRKDKTSRSMATKPCFNSLCTPNLVKRLMKEKTSACCSQKSEKYTLSNSLNIQNFSNFSAMSVSEFQPSCTLQSKDFLFKGKTSDTIPIVLESSTQKNSQELNQEVLTNISEPLNKVSKTVNNVTEEEAAGGLTALLSQGSLKRYAEKFRDQEIDLETFKYLTEEDLDEIGISSFNSRHKLMEIIDKLKNC